MDRIISLEEIGKYISEIRSFKKGFLTNFYFDNVKHSLWIVKGVLYSERIGDTAFLVRKNDGFWNVFYISTVYSSFKDDLNCFIRRYPDNVLMFDNVLNARMFEPMRELFASQGLNEYSSLVRMSRKSVFMEYLSDFEKVEYAINADATEIMHLLNSYFDAKGEQIPFIEEIEEYIKLNHVLVYRHNSIIIGFVIFEKNKSTQYLRYWFVHPEYRNMKIGSILLKRFFYEGNDTVRQLFWVIQTNENAIVRYKHYGFNEEEMFDLITSNINNTYGK